MLSEVSWMNPTRFVYMDPTGQSPPAPPHTSQKFVHPPPPTHLEIPQVDSPLPQNFYFLPTKNQFPLPH